MELRVLRETYFVWSREILPSGSIVDRAAYSYPVIGITTTCVLGMVSESAQQPAARQLHNERIVDIADSSGNLADWAPGQPMVLTAGGDDNIGAVNKRCVHPHDRAILEPGCSWVCSIAHDIHLVLQTDARFRGAWLVAGHLLDFVRETCEAHLDVGPARRSG
jgi:hypothetical protein